MLPFPQQSQVLRNDFASHARDGCSRDGRGTQIVADLELRAGPARIAIADVVRFFRRELMSVRACVKAGPSESHCEIAPERDIQSSDEDRLMALTTVDTESDAASLGHDHRFALIKVMARDVKVPIAPRFEALEPVLAIGLSGDQGSKLARAGFNASAMGSDNEDTSIPHSCAYAPRSTALPAFELGKVVVFVSLAHTHPEAPGA